MHWKLHVLSALDLHHEPGFGSNTSKPRCLGLRNGAGRLVFRVPRVSGFQGFRASGLQGFRAVGMLVRSLLDTYLLLDEVCSWLFLGPQKQDEVKCRLSPQEPSSLVEAFGAYGLAWSSRDECQTLEHLHSTPHPNR